MLILRPKTCSLFVLITTTIGHYERCRQVEAVSTEGRQALIEHHLSPSQFGAATPPPPWGVGPAHGKVDGHHQLAITDDHQQQHAINTLHHALVLPTPPRADQLQLAPIFANN